MRTLSASTLALAVTSRKVGACQLFQLTRAVRRSTMHACMHPCMLFRCKSLSVSACTLPDANSCMLLHACDSRSAYDAPVALVLIPTPSARFLAFRGCVGPHWACNSFRLHRQARALLSADAPCYQCVACQCMPQLCSSARFVHLRVLLQCTRCILCKRCL